MAKRESRRGYPRLNGMVDVFDGMLAALTNVQQPPQAEPAAMPRGNSRNIAIIGPQGGGKSVLAKAITRLALDSSSVMDNPDYRIRFDELPVMDSGNAAENIQQYQDWLFKLVYEEGLQADKTSLVGATKVGAHRHLLDQANDIENFRLPPIKLKVENFQKNLSIPFLLSMLDLPGELMASELQFSKEDITQEMLERAAAGEGDTGVTLANGLMKLAMADLLLIVIPMRLSVSEGFDFKIYLSRALNLFFDVLRKKCESKYSIFLPDIYFCFSKYEATFLDGEVNRDLCSQEKTRECAHNALVAFFESRIANGISQVLIDAYSDMKFLSDDINIAMPNVALSCMSSFGFQPDCIPNVRTIRNGDTAADVLGTSQVGADLHDDLYVGADDFHLLDHWVPFGVEEPILEAASQVLFPAGGGEVPNRSGRRSFSFEEFFLPGFR